MTLLVTQNNRVVTDEHASLDTGSPKALAQGCSGVADGQLGVLELNIFVSFLHYNLLAWEYEQVAIDHDNMYSAVTQKLFKEQEWHSIIMMPNDACLTDTAQAVVRPRRRRTKIRCGQVIRKEITTANSCL